MTSAGQIKQTSSNMNWYEMAMRSDFQAIPTPEENIWSHLLFSMFDSPHQPVVVYVGSLPFCAGQLAYNQYTNYPVWASDLKWLPSVLYWGKPWELLGLNHVDRRTKTMSWNWLESRIELQTEVLSGIGCTTNPFTLHGVISKFNQWFNVNRKIALGSFNDWLTQKNPAYILHSNP